MIGLSKYNDNRIIIFQTTVPLKMRFKGMYSNLKFKLSTKYVAFKSSKIVLFVKKNQTLFKIIFLIILILVLNLSPGSVKLVRADDDFKLPLDDLQKWLRDRNYTKYLKYKPTSLSPKQIRRMKEYQEFLRDMYEDKRPLIRPRSYKFAHPAQIDSFIRNYNTDPEAPPRIMLKAILDRQEAREASLSFFNKYIFPNTSIYVVIGAASFCAYVLAREYYFYKD